MNPSIEPKPGTSSQSENPTTAIAGLSKQQPNKLDLLTSEEVDKFITTETLAQYEYSGSRHLLIFNKNQIEETSRTNVEDPGDEFYELSQREGKKLLQDIIRIRDQLENGQLMTKAMRDLNSAKRTLATLHQYNYSVVRLHLPDGIVLQALFKPLENVDKVRAYFQQLLERPDLDFYIYLTPPKTILQGSSTLLDLRCVPTANFYFGVTEPPSLDVVASQSSVETSLGLPGEIEQDTRDKSVIADETRECNSVSQQPVVRYVNADVLSQHLVTRRVADEKAAEFRRAKNPALTFMDDPDPCALTHSAQSPPELTPGVSKANRPRTSADKIPKWFKTGK